MLVDKSRFCIIFVSNDIIYVLCASSHFWIFTKQILCWSMLLKICISPPTINTWKPWTPFFPGTRNQLGFANAHQPNFLLELPLFNTTFIWINGFGKQACFCIFFHMFSGYLESHVSTLVQYNSDKLTGTSCWKLWASVTQLGGCLIWRCCLSWGLTSHRARLTNWADRSRSWESCSS